MVTVHTLIGCIALKSTICRLLHKSQKSVCTTLKWFLLVIESKAWRELLELKGALRGDNWVHGPLVSGRTVLPIHSDISCRQRAVKGHLRGSLVLCCHPVATIMTAFPVDNTKVRQHPEHTAAHHPLNELTSIFSYVYSLKFWLCSLCCRLEAQLTRDLLFSAVTSGVALKSVSGFMLQFYSRRENTAFVKGLFPWTTKRGQLASSVATQNRQVSPEGGVGRLEVVALPRGGHTRAVAPYKSPRGGGSRQVSWDRMAYLDGAREAVSPRSTSQDDPRSPHHSAAGLGGGSRGWRNE